MPVSVQSFDCVLFISKAGQSDTLSILNWEETCSSLWCESVGSRCIDQMFHLKSPGAVKAICSDRDWLGCGCGCVKMLSRKMNENEWMNM
ncbi:hypothetical protein NPIL_207051 [Nephila pilipes]|uniref:Uncharacterized protein n=1 Tax=Nephila pilipes TaxID=299642 RepID=A0A8X6N1H0_NEPPI|nr:hypothetical protein NPIL_207051 [Nephila pilipes]